MLDICTGECTEVTSLSKIEMIQHAEQYDKELEDKRREAKKNYEEFSNQYLTSKRNIEKTKEEMRINTLTHIKEFVISNEIILRILI